MSNQLTDEQIISQRLGFEIGSPQLADAMSKFEVRSGQVFRKDTDFELREERLNEMHTRIEERIRDMNTVGDTAGLTGPQIENIARFKISMQVHEGVPPIK